jgi:hypothetical protein
MREKTYIGITSFGGLLTITFIVLKLTKIINWSWVWILSPIWIPSAFFVGIIIVLISIVVINYFRK